MKNDFLLLRIMSVSSDTVCYYQSSKSWQTKNTWSDFTNSYRKTSN